MKLKRVFLVLAGFAFVVVFSSCTTFRADGLSFSMPDVNDVSLGDFSRKVIVHEFLGGPGGINLFNISSDAMNSKITDIIWSEMQKKGGNAARNISIKYSVGFPGLLANTITRHIWAPATLTIKGEVIKTSSATAQIETNNEITLALADADK